MVEQVFPEPYGIDQDSEVVLDAYGAPAFEPPSEEPDYFFSISEYIAEITKTLDVGAITVTAIPIEHTVHLTTPTITVTSNAVSTSLSILFPTAGITVESEAVTLVFGPIELSTAHIDIEAVALTPLIGPTWIYCTTGSIDVEAIEIATSEADNLPTAEITVEAIAISTTIATLLPEASITVETEAGTVIIGVSLTTASLTVSAIPVDIPIFLDTAHIDVEGIPGHTGEVTVLTTAHVDVEYGVVYPCVEFELAQDSWLTINLYRSDPGEIPPPDPVPPPDNDPTDPPIFDEDMYIGVENPSIGRFELLSSATAYLVRGE